MHSSSSPEFGVCPCGGKYAATFVKVSFAAAARIPQLEDVPQGNCPTCAGRVYKLADLERVESVMRSNRSTT